MKVFHALTLLTGVAATLLMGTPAQAAPLAPPPPCKGCIAIRTLGANADGLTIYDVEPKDELDSITGYFINKGAYKVDEVNDYVTAFQPDDVKKYKLHCEYLCADVKGNIVGRVFLPKIDAKRLNASRK